MKLNEIDTERRDTQNSQDALANQSKSEVQKKKIETRRNEWRMHGWHTIKINKYKA